MAKVLGIEIGASKIRICEADYKAKNPKVYQSISIKTPEGVVNDGEIFLNDQLITVMRDALQIHKIRTKQIVFSMNSTKIASREIVIPFVKENKISDLIRANASDYFPVDLEQYELGHTILATMENEKGDKQYKVLVLAAPKMMIEGYYQLANAMGCSVAAMDYSGNSIYQAVRNHCGTGVEMVIKVDENSTLITILDNQAISMQRTVAYGVEDAVFTVMNIAALGRQDYDGAVALMREQNVLQEEIEQSLSYLVGGISRVVDYYSRSGGAPIEKAYLTGMGEDFLGLAELISKNTEISLTPLTQMEGLQLDKYFKDASFGEYITCIGAAIAPIGFVGEKESKKGSMDVLPKSQDMDKIAMLVMAGGILIAAVLILTSTLSLQSAQKENKRLKTRIEELQPAKLIQEQYLQQKYTYDKLNYFYNSTITPNEELVEFIEEMEEKMPSSLNVQSFSANLEGVTMSLTVRDKSEAAKLIQQFRSFDSVGSIAVSSIADAGAVMTGQPLEEEPKVSFSITVSYKGYEAISPAAPQPVAEEAETEAEAQAE
ncbi:MAG: pilus assembly protein PilM [Lachnospiraceae bacterium]|nr:pilus assembly protein PilM [Lachnospiraceae bacterium]